MKMPTREQKIASLKIARKRLVSNEEDYICVALAGTPACKYLKEYILKELGGSYTYRSWLRTNLTEDPITNEEVKQGRIQWIDWMIDNAT